MNRDHEHELHAGIYALLHAVHETRADQNADTLLRAAELCELLTKREPFATASAADGSLPAVAALGVGLAVARSLDNAAAHARKLAHGLSSTEPMDVAVIGPSRDEFIRSLANVLEAYDCLFDCRPSQNHTLNTTHVTEARKLLSQVLP